MKPTCKFKGKRQEEAEKIFNKYLSGIFYPIAEKYDEKSVNDFSVSYTSNQIREFKFFEANFILNDGSFKIKIPFTSADLFNITYVRQVAKTSNDLMDKSGLIESIKTISKKEDYIFQLKDEMWNDIIPISLFLNGCYGSNNIQDSAKFFTTVDNLIDLYLKK